MPAAKRLSREEAKERTREKLLAAGRKVFAASGLEGTQIRDVIGEAGLAIGTFYLHFKSKEELFVAIVEESAARLRERSRAARRGTGETGTPSVEKRVENACRAFCEFVVEERDFFRVLFQTDFGAGGRKTSRRLNEIATQELREDIEESFELGYLAPDDRDRLAGAVIGLCTAEGFRIASQKRPDVDASTRFLTRMILGGTLALAQGAK